ncbi:proline/glycine betaine ABC transporter permease [Thalassobaculum sp.]|uniref:ABC transporter permease n=1 Tax=Thalassobaculum sp. TaxID=2022740 RepID=UPI0032ED90B1
MADPLPRPSDLLTLPLDDWIEWLVKDQMVPLLRPVFQALQWPVNQILGGFEVALLAIPFLVFMVAGCAVAWRVAGRNVAIFTAVALVFLDLVGIWEESMTTLSMVLTAVLFCALVGVPLGIWAGRSDRFAAGIRPVLDIMQTTPAFVYLVPVVMLFGVGMVPGVIATIIFSMPPIIRLTNLGIRQVSGDLVEAGHAFGATPRQILFEIQIPLALRAILAGLNQTLMLSLSMVVIAALIGAEGLGLIVFQGIGRLDVGLAALGGIGIVLIAIVLDRLTQAVGDADGEPRSFRALFAKLAGRRPAAADEADPAGEPHSRGA